MKIFWIGIIYVVDFYLYICLFFVAQTMKPRAVVDMCPATELCPWPPAL